MSRIHVDIWDHALPKVLPPDLYEPLPSHGGEVFFFGRVRNHNQGRVVSALSYDAFVPLAKETLLVIAREAQARWGEDLCVTAIHRTGKLVLGEDAVVVAVSARHRQEAYLASQYVIEELKHRAPLWKKEHYVDGDSEWLQGHALCGHSHSPSVGAQQKSFHLHSSCET